MNKDQEIINCIRSGKQGKAISYLYDTSLKKVKAYILKNNGTKDDADDIFQDAIIAFFNYVKEGKFNEKYTIDAFIFSVARNLWIDKTKESKKYNNVPDYSFEGISDGTSQLNTLINEEVQEAVVRVFKQLEQKCQDILSLVLYERLSMKEIKEKMGYSSEDVAKSTHYRCKQALAKIVKSNQQLIDLLSL